MYPDKIMHTEAARGSSGNQTLLTTVFGSVLLMRLLFPFFDSPLRHLFSDPLRHWEAGREFLHPTVLGSGDPYLYQLWMYLVRDIAGGSDAAVLAACGLLCAAMPYGWYRALRELMPREWALGSATCIALVPGFLGIYAYFMNETLLLTLTAFAFWLTLRAVRKRSLGAFAAAFALWLAAMFTRIAALPMAVVCLSELWLTQPQKTQKAMVAVVLGALLTIPAGLHGRASLGYFAPWGNLYLNEIYHDSGSKNIRIDFGSKGVYVFGSPSFYNPTFFPFSLWTTSREGTVSIAIDTRNGRADWMRELACVRLQRHGSAVQDRWENLQYLLFAQQWPDNDRNSAMGALTLWSRWLWPPMMLMVASLAMRGRFHGREWLLPGCALLGVTLLALQSEGVMEGRFRKPFEPVFVAALALALQPRRNQGVAHAS